VRLLSLANQHIIVGLYLHRGLQRCPLVCVCLPCLFIVPASLPISTSNTNQSSTNNNAMACSAHENAKQSPTNDHSFSRITMDLVTWKSLHIKHDAYTHFKMTYYWTITPTALHRAMRKILTTLLPRTWKTVCLITA
jgi:hypothetical protein